jgi:hypothetical protein
LRKCGACLVEGGREIFLARKRGKVALDEGFWIEDEKVTDAERVVLELRT